MSSKEDNKKAIKFLNNNTQFREEYFPKRPALDLSFKNVKYIVSRGSLFKQENKEILHGVCGEFRSGELTAIMGPSGAGKSTLLDIMAGYKVSGLSGSVFVNGEDRCIGGLNRFRKLSCYIQQDDALRPHLTVAENMIIASHLKLGTDVSEQKKKDQIFQLLQMLGLYGNTNTLTKQLSGGQKKRLSVALELITNPPIIFLDEPTTGLDSSSCSQCVQLLKSLAEQGRTIICTIHQPSALMFERFDHLYAVAGGNCIYQGTITGLVPYFSQFNLNCPPYHNPADFLIEVATGEYEYDSMKLVASASRNGRNPTDPSYAKYRKRNAALSSDEVVEFTSSLPRSPSSLLQAFYLFTRSAISAKRTKSQLALRLLAHFFIAIIFGYLYKDSGKMANRIMANSIYLYGSNLFLVYTGQMAVILSFPLELEMLKREHFNRWYSLSPYIFSMLSIEIPFQILCCITYMIPSYILTNQSMETFRIIYFVVVGILTSLTAQATGFFFGVTLPVNVSVFVGPVLMVLLSAFGFAIRLSDIPLPFKWLHYVSFIRSSYQTLLYSAYGLNRDPLECETTYCHFKYPIQFLNEMDVTNFNMTWEISYICFVFIFVYLTTSYFIWHRLNRR